MIGKTTVWAVTTTLGATWINAYSKIILCNDSDEVIYIWINAPAVLNQWIRLNANWWIITIDWTFGWVNNVSTINAICASWNKNLSYCLI